jgi:predicted O-linked N-acetylglucosamine transferase (SPINDLY family)
MGAPYIDYIVADPALIPAEHAGNFSERVAWLPDTYQVNDRQVVADEVPDRAALSLPPDGFVFCCFNNSFKFTAPVFAAWMRILKNVPGSVLWLATDSVDVVANLRTQARRHDVHPDRLVFAPRVARREDHLARHSRADLFLDTMPFNAHATASDALWCGLPVLTCAGQTFAGRVAASLDGQSGLDALVCRDLAHYESVAVDLAHDPHRLSQLRLALNEKRETGPLFDADRFRRNLEAAYEGMWQRWCDGLAPESFRSV